MSILSKSSHIGVFLLLLLLCSVCVAPVMAGNEKYIIEDGVHLIKSDDSPTRLDQLFYHIESSADVVVDGNQFYWVRIGGVVSKGLTTVWWIPVVVLLIILISLIVITIGYSHTYRRFFPELYANLAISEQGIYTWNWAKSRLMFIVPLACVCALVLNTLVYGALVSGLTHVVCGDYPALKASDGTILLKVDKLHPETNTLYMNSGVNLTRLTHLSCSGTMLHGTRVSPT